MLDCRVLVSGFRTGPYPKSPKNGKCKLGSPIDFHIQYAPRTKAGAQCHQSWTGWKLVNHLLHSIVATNTLKDFKTLSTHMGQPITGKSTRVNIPCFNFYLYFFTLSPIYNGDFPISFCFDVRRFGSRYHYVPVRSLLGSKGKASWSSKNKWWSGLTSHINYSIQLLFELFLDFPNVLFWPICHLFDGTFLDIHRTDLQRRL